jgi:type 1 fimbriae regulatory protein FimB/type 1 fimbriae regulatory protein FimE
MSILHLYRDLSSIARKTGLAAKVYGRHKVRNYALLLLIFRHGLRVSEATDLRWDAISFLDDTRRNITRRRTNITYGATSR